MGRIGTSTRLIGPHKGWLRDIRVSAGRKRAQFAKLDRIAKKALSPLPDGVSPSTVLPPTHRREAATSENGRPDNRVNAKAPDALESSLPVCVS